jgi:hypothetical protein
MKPPNKPLSETPLAEEAYGKALYCRWRKYCVSFDGLRSFKFADLLEEAKVRRLVNTVEELLWRDQQHWNGVRWQWSRLSCPTG